MSWMQKLYQTYELVQKQGLADEELALPFHISKAVHLKVVLNDKAELVDVIRFGGKTQIPIQVTEKSSKRSGSTIAAYALHDSLQYVAKTAKQYLTIEYISKIAEKKATQKGGGKWREFLRGSDSEKSKFTDIEKEKYQNSFEFYEQQLSDWVNESDLLELEIVLKYIQKGSLIEDLLAKKFFSIEDHILLSGKNDPFDFTIVWAVEMPSNDPHSELWSKPCIQNAWIEYQENKIERGIRQKSLCHITGDLDYPTEAYLKTNGNAKLVSANDHSGFTFRGRFLGKDDGADSLGQQAVCLGNNAYQKASNILKWLINRQGIRNGKQVILAWSSNCMSEEDKSLSSYYSPDDIYTNLFAQDNIYQSADIGYETFERLKKKLHGYQQKLTDNDRISLLMLDEPSKTGGRMSLVFYQEKLANDYFEDLEAWQNDFSWYQLYKSKWFFIAPSVECIAETVLTKTEFEDKDVKAKRQLYASLLPVISGGNDVQISYILVQKAIQIACNPFHYQKTKENKNSEEKRKEHWQRNIGVACALYKGWRARHSDSSQRRTYDMSLDTQNRSRDYLYGRLLAVAENIESYALHLAEEKRATTAERYMQRFAEHPFATWRNIELALKPYQDRLRSRSKDTGTQAIGEIMELFQHDDFTCDNKLSGEFLLGYHCQKMELTRQIAERKAAKQQQTETN